MSGLKTAEEAFAAYVLLRASSARGWSPCDDRGQRSQRTVRFDIPASGELRSVTLSPEQAGRP